MRFILSAFALYMARVVEMARAVELVRSPCQQSRRQKASREIADVPARHTASEPKTVRAPRWLATPDPFL